MGPFGETKELIGGLPGSSSPTASTRAAAGSRPAIPVSPAGLK